MLEPQWNRWEGERVRVWLGNDDACHPTGSNGVISRCRCSSCRRPQLLLLLITFFLEDFNWSFLFLPLSSLSFFISFINDITQLYLLSCSVCVDLFTLFNLFIYLFILCVFFQIFFVKVYFQKPTIVFRLLGFSCFPLLFFSVNFAQTSDKDNYEQLSLFF